MNSNNPDSLIQKEAPPFYLKIHRNTDDALKCFWHWVDIAKEMGADFYVVCDKVELTNRLAIDAGMRGESLKIISSYRQQAAIILNGLMWTDKWVNIGIALFTPFLHAKENDYDNFWNIDADDSMLLLDANTCAKALKMASEYADENKIDCLSLDFHVTTYLHLTPPHWNFGCVYTKNLVDYIEIIQNAKKLVPLWRNERKVALGSIDGLFRGLSFYSFIKAETFCIHNMGFNHDKSKHIWRSDHIDLLYITISEIIRKRIDGNDFVNGLPIPENCVMIDAGISENESREWTEKNNIDDVYFDKLQMLHKQIDIMLKYANDVEKTRKLLDNESKRLFFNRTSDFLRNNGFHFNWKVSADFSSSICPISNERRNYLKIIALHNTILVEIVLDEVKGYSDSVKEKVRGFLKKTADRYSDFKVNPNPSFFIGTFTLAYERDEDVSEKVGRLVLRIVNRLFSDLYEIGLLSVDFDDDKNLARDIHGLHKKYKDEVMQDQTNNDDKLDRENSRMEQQIELGVSHNPHLA